MGSGNTFVRGLGGQTAADVEVHPDEYPSQTGTYSDIWWPDHCRAVGDWPISAADTKVLSVAGLGSGNTFVRGLGGQTTPEVEVYPDEYPSQTGTYF